MLSGPPDKQYPEEFERDYYDELKAKYAHLKNVEIFSKDDYELDPTKTPWLGDEGRVDVKALRKQVNASPIQPGELDVAPDRPFRHTDLHSQEDIESFESRFRTHDAVSGRYWEDPMPESDFDHDEKWIDFRKMDVDAEQTDEDVFAEASPRPLKRKQYASFDEEFAAVMASADRMQAENLDQPIPKTAWAESVPVPDPDEFARWQRAAEERGGNSTSHDSNFLPPAKKVERRPKLDAQGIEPPPQRQSMVEAHAGSWTGDVTVFSISSGHFSVTTQRRCSVKSRVSICDNGGLEWSSAVDDNDMELVSEVSFSPVEHMESLIPGRGVSSDGSYVQNSPSCGSSTRSPVYADISLGQKFLATLTEDKNCRAELEICMVSGSGEGLRRDRVCICTGSTPDADKKKATNNSDKFVFVVVLSEYRDGCLEAHERNSRRNRMTELGSYMLRGKWTGSGILLHPEFPPLGCTEVKTFLSFTAAENITEDSVTWVENELSDEPGRESKARQRTLGKKKISKRVAAARAHDRRRLSECSFLSKEAIGSESKAETHGWKLLPSAEAFTSMLSPRVGKFVDDYCAVVLPDGMVVTFPFGKAFPKIWNSISLMKADRPVRKRILAGRNEFGDLVGVAFVTESVEDEELCDEAASYV